jgi:selenide,water dikinase
MSRGAGLAIEIDADAPALLPGVEALVRAGVVTGASGRNWASYGAEVRFEAEAWRRDLLTDPQTSGGLLIAIAPDRAEWLVGLARDRGFAASRIVGKVGAGPPGLVARSRS